MGVDTTLGTRRFIDGVPVLKADGPSSRSRLALCRLSADTLKLGLGLGLLGIPSLERMGVGGLGEFRLRLFGHRAGILPNPCSRVPHGLATVGLTLIITRPQDPMLNNHLLCIGSGE